MHPHHQLLPALCWGWGGTDLQVSHPDPHKSSILDPLTLQVVGNHSEGTARLPARFSECVVPPGQDRVGVNGAVIALKHTIYLGRLDPAARLAAHKSLLEQGSPVANGADEVPNVDEIEGVARPGPGQRRVVDFKLEIRRHP